MGTQNTSLDRASIYQISLRAFTPEGTLKAAEKLLPFVASLGPKYVQLLPVVQADDGEDQAYWSKRQMASGTGNPKNNYRMKDYFAIDEEYGTQEDLRDFVLTAHRLGLGVLLDLVYFHCGPNAVFLEEHPDFVKRNDDGTPYTGEWNFPVLNYESQELREYLWKNMEYFVEKFDIDGYRCDVGFMIPLDFWAEGIKRIRAIKPDLYMVNEGYNSDYLRVFDVNYFYDGCFDAVPVAQGKMSARQFCEKWEACRQTLPEGGGRMLHFIDNHDVASDSGQERHEKTIGTAGVDALLVLDFLLDGVPFVFNGYEVADDLKHNMFSNRFYGKDAAVNWANVLCEKGRKRIRLLQKLYRLHGENDALCTKALVWGKHTAPDQVAAFYRPDGDRPWFAAVNMTNTPVSFVVEEIPETLHLLEAELAENARWTFRGAQMEIQLLGYGYLAGSYPELK